MRKLFLSACLVAATAVTAQVNLARLSTTTNKTQYYNTADLNAIELDTEGGTVTVNTSYGDAQSFSGSVSSLSFVKQGAVQITEAKGWQESAYAEWSLLEGADGYHVYVKGGQYADYTLIDNELVRRYADYGRADVVGLQAGTYSLKVVPVVDGREVVANAAEKSGLEVKAYDRNGYAHFNYTSGVGAYNNDGTLKANAEVIYVTAATAKTVKATLSSGEFTGLQAIITAFEKGNVTTPLAVRFIGTIKAADVDAFGSSEEGIQVKGRKADSELNITFEGIGDDATIQGFGFLCRNCKSVEFRNFGIMRCMDDGISLDTDNSNIWLHNMDVYYGKGGSGDHAKGDGAIDVKSDSKYVTLSYCHFWDTGKSNMFGMKSETGPNYITYHHNWFDHSDSRHPRIRTMSVHVYNNYYDGNAKYGVGVTTGACCFAENNYFRHAHDPLLSSQQGTDAKGDGTFSSEQGGIIKSYGNVYAETGGSAYYTPITYQTNSTSFDCYEASTRDEQVPATVVALVGGTTYNNFDTNASLIYTYTPDAANDVPAIVTGYYGAGRLNHGDCQYTFNNEVDDTDYDVNTALASLIDGYKTSFLGFFGEDEATTTGEGGEGGEGGGTEEVPEGTIVATFNGSCSSSLFDVASSEYGDGKVTYEGTYYKQGLKLNSKGSITFTPQKNYNMTIVLATGKSGRNVQLNGSNTTVNGTENAEGKYYEMEPIAVTAGTQYILKKGSAESLVMIIKLEPTE